MLITFLKHLFCFVIYIPIRPTRLAKRFRALCVLRFSHLSSGSYSTLIVGYRYIYRSIVIGPIAIGHSYIARLRPMVSTGSIDIWLDIKIPL